MPDDMMASVSQGGAAPASGATDADTRAAARFGIQRFPIVEIIDRTPVWAVPENMLDDVREYAAGPWSRVKHPFLITSEFYVALTVLRRWLSYNGWVRHVDPRYRRSPWGARFHAKPGGQELCIPVPAVDSQQARMANRIIRHWRMLRRGQVSPPSSRSIGLQREGPDVFAPPTDPEELMAVTPEFVKRLYARLLFELMIEEADCENPLSRRDGGDHDNGESAALCDASENQTAVSQ